MSKLASKSSKLAAPRSVAQKPSVQIQTQAKEKKAAAKKEFALPAFSVSFPVNATGAELEKLKKKTIRRNAPPGEDLKAIKEILKSLKNSPDVTVQEFIALIGPSVTDRGEGLRQVMNEDLQSFRKLARKVYEMITQDNSDVLLNQQLQLADFYKEKKTLYQDKMMRSIAEIYSMAPNFDFDRYTKEPEKYLNFLFPLPAELKIEPEEIEMMKRQAAYHRLQWLRSEGERLNDENSSLRKRLYQMKKLHLIEQQKMAEKEREVEEKREALEAAEADKKETLDILNQSLEKSIIQKELIIRQKKDADALAPRAPAGSGTGAVRKTKSKGALKKKMKPRPKWNECAAKDIEERNIEEYRQAEGVKATSPFHFSPIKSPPRGTAGASRERSPFHFSPIKTPPREDPSARQRSPFHYSPVKSPPRIASPMASSSRAEAGAAVSAQASAASRRSLAPRDSWGGFR